MHRAQSAAALALAAALLLGAVPLKAQDDTLSLSLQDALAIAAKNSFDVKVEKLVFDQAEMRYAAAHGAYDPVASFYWSHGDVRNPVSSVLQAGMGTAALNSRQDYYNFGLTQATPWGQTFGLTWDNNQNESNSAYTLFNPTYNTNFELTTTVPLLQGFGKVADITRQQARLGWESASFTYAQGLRDTLLQVERSYWNLVYARESLEVSRMGLKLAQNFQAETAARIRAGVLAPIEQVTADASVAQREQDILVAESTAANTEDIFKLALGVTQGSGDWDRHYVPTDAPARNRGDYKEAELIARAQERRPEIGSLQKTLESNRLDTAWAKNQKLPRLDFVGTLNYAGTAGDFFNTQTSTYVDQAFPDAWDQVWGRDYRGWTVGLSVRYPIFNRAAKYTFSAYKLAETATEIQLEKTKLLIANDVRLSLRNLQTTEKRISAAELTVRLQKEKLDAEQKKYQNGLSTSFNVLSYQNDLTAAQSALLKARIDNQIAVADLDRAVGTYLESKGIALPELQGEPGSLTNKE